MDLAEPNILLLLKEAVAYAKPDHNDILEKMTLDSTMSDLGIESVSALEMAGYLEEKLGIQFPDDKLTSVHDLRGMANLICDAM